MGNCSKCVRNDEATYLETLLLPEEYRNENYFHACTANKLYAKIKDFVQLEKFLERWCGINHVTWRVTSTNPQNMSAGIKNIYYAKYHCQHSNRKVSTSTKNAHAKHIKCTAEMIITIKKIGQRCQSKNKHFPEYPTVIVFKNNHNHNLYCGDSVKWKDVCQETKNEFVKLFQNGHSPYTALDVHKSELLLKYGDEFFTISQNRALCPDIGWCYRLYNSIQKQEYGAVDEVGIQDKIHKLQFSEFVTTATFEERPVVTICTAFMKRVHRLWPYSAEMVFVDSTGNFDRLQHRVFVVLTHSFAGALPLGIIITCTEKADAVALGLRLLLGLVGENGFYKQKHPSFIMTDHSTSERNGIAQVFPSATLLLCTFHILQALWRYIWKSESQVPKENRVEIFNLVRQLVYEKNETVLQEKYEKLLLMDIINIKMRKYITDLWNIKEEWAHCYRTGKLRGNHTNNYAESTMRILKDKLFHRQRAYNIIQLIDICMRLDNYYEKKLLDVAKGSDFCVQPRYRLQFQKINDLEVTHEDGHIFFVKNLTKKTEYYVDIENELCQCFIGCTRAPCKHQAAVLNKYPNHGSSNFYTCSKEQRLLLHELATGTVANVPENWYARLHEVEEMRDKTNNTSNPVDNMQQNTYTVNTEMNKENIDYENLDEASILEQDNLKAEFEKFREIFQTKITSVAGIRMFQTFFKKVFNLKTDAALESALYNFGKRISKKTISVQSTSIARRKTKLGGINPITPGRPLKLLNPNNLEHHYATKMRSGADRAVPFKKKRRPHNLSYCTQEN